jgi:Fe2+ or Zn2+ uptake regulation protein
VRSLKESQYCDVYGHTIRNKILVEFLINQYMGTAVPDIVEETGISKPKVYEIVKEFLEKGYLEKSRLVGRTQLYILNKEHPHSKLFLRNFKECLKMPMEEHSESKHTKSAARVVAAKR